MTTNNPHKIRLTSFNLNSINNIQRNQSKQARFRNPQIRCQFQTLEITIKKTLIYKPKTLEADDEESGIGRPRFFGSVVASEERAEVGAAEEGESCQVAQKTRSSSALTLCSRRKRVSGERGDRETTGER